MPTALELRREGWRRFIQTVPLQRLPSELTAAQKEEKEQLLQGVKKVATILKKRFKVRRVILFGSLAQAAGFETGSDVDLAVEGLDAAKYWDAWEAAEEIICDRPVDLVEMETASTSLQSAIKKLGIEL